MLSVVTVLCNTMGHVHTYPLEDSCSLLPLGIHWVQEYPSIAQGLVGWAQHPAPSNGTGRHEDRGGTDGVLTLTNATRGL